MAQNVISPGGAYGSSTIDVDKMTVDELLRALGPRADPKSVYGKSPYDITHQGLWYQKPDPVDLNAYMANQEGGSPPYDDWATGAPISAEQRGLGYSQIWRNMPGNSREYGLGTPTGELVPGSSFSQNLNQDKNVMLAALAAGGLVTAPMWAGAAAGAGAGGGGAAGLGAAEAAGATGATGGGMAVGGGITAPSGVWGAGTGGAVGSAAAPAAAAGAGWTWANTAQTLAGLAGAAAQSGAIKDAARTQTEATANALAEQRRQYDLNRGDLAPYRDAGVGALGQLQTGLNTPTTAADVMQDPGYQFALDQGQQALDRRFSASGGRLSGASLKAASRFNTGTAAAGYGAAYTRGQDRLSRLETLAGLGQSATSNTVAAGGNSANAISGLISSQGNATGGAQMARGNIWGDTINQIGAMYGRSQNPPSGMRYDPRTGQPIGG